MFIGENGFLYGEYRVIKSSAAGMTSLKLKDTGENLLNFVSLT